MFAALMYELSEFFNKAAKKIFILYTVALFLISLFSIINAEYYFYGFLSFMILISAAVLYGKEKNKNVEKYFIEDKILPAKFVAVKILFSLALLFIFILFAAPFFIYSVYLSGLKGVDIAKIVSVCVFCYLITEKVSWLAYRMKTENKILFAFYFLFSLNILTLFVPYLRVMSPFYAIYLILNDESGLYYFYFLITFVFISGIIIFECNGLKRKYE